jgi:hypothetical protein
MATMMYQYSDLYNRVSKFLGTYGSSGPSGTDLIDAQDFVKSGCLQFLTSHDWTFRRRYSTITTESGKYIYELPQDFGGIRTKFCFSQETGYPPLGDRSEQEIMELRGYGEYNAYPEIYTIRSGLYDPQGGQRYEVLFWPTPSSEYILYYSFYYMPAMMSNDTDVPMGGAEMSEAIRAMCLAAAEGESDEAVGPQAQRAQIELAKAIELDKKREPRELGYMGNYSGINAWEVARGSTRINNVNYNL